MCQLRVRISRNVIVIKFIFSYLSFCGAKINLVFPNLTGETEKTTFLLGWFFCFLENLIKLKKFLAMPNFIQKRINLFIHGGLISLFFLALFLLVGNFAYAQSSPNAGVVKGIWYSQFPFFAGDKIKINLAI